MNTTLLTLSLLVPAALSAQTLTWVGGGKGVMNGRSEVTFTSTLTVDVIVPDKEAVFNELTEMATGEKYQYSYKITIGDKGVVTVSSGKQTIGGGYCFAQPDGGKWCDYKISVPEGLIHYNFYHDVQSKQLYRMGDATGPNGETGFWSEALRLK